MNRLPADCSDEIAFRHHCAETAQDSTDAILAQTPPRNAVMIAPGTEVPLRPSLSEAFQIIRGPCEIEEVYVRLFEKKTFAPLSAEHLGRVGEWIMVARRRALYEKPRVVGVMLAKDEADVLPEVIASLHSSLHRLYLLPKDEPTRASAIASASPNWLRLAPAPEERGEDGARQRLLEWARTERAEEEDPRPMWVMVVQGDEIYNDDLLQHVLLAEEERATVMTCQVATFLLHESQREIWDWSLPLDRRLTHYIWDFGEHAGFLDFPWIHYREKEHMRAFPHGLWPAKYASARPVRKHYPFRNPDQARARIEDRIRSGWQPHYAHYQKIFMSNEAAGRPLKHYWGWFPEAERIEGIW